MLRMAPLQSHQIEEAKYVISAVAQRIFEPHMTVQEFYDVLAREDELHDVDDFEKAYMENRGLFLVVMDDDRLVGTGALKKLDENIAELKRIWLLEEYHGRNIGFQVVKDLLEFGRAHEYTHVRLQTSDRQKRAIHFYKKMGFQEIPGYRHGFDNISMELKL